VPLVWSRVLGPWSWIWHILRWFLEAPLRRSEAAASSTKPGISAIKAPSSCSVFWFSAMLLLPLLAGRGGEGEGSSGRVGAMFLERWGVPSAQALRRGARASPAGLSDVLPWWEASDFALQVRLPSNKRFHHRPCSPLGDGLLVFLLLAGRGGEGEDGGPVAAAWTRQVFPEAAPCGAPKLRRSRRRYPRPERPLHARLYSSPFFLMAKTTHRSAQGPNRKSSFGFSMGFTTGIAPSGLFPGGDAGSRAWKPLSGGEDEGLDRVFTFYFRVLSDYLQALSVIPLVHRGALVTLYPPTG